jgi:hypothetical protein
LKHKSYFRGLLEGCRDRFTALRGCEQCECEPSLYFHPVLSVSPASSFHVLISLYVVHIIRLHLKEYRIRLLYDDDNKPVWPTWAVGALQGCETYSHQSRMFSHNFPVIEESGHPQAGSSQRSKTTQLGLPKQH